MHDKIPAHDAEAELGLLAGMLAAPEAARGAVSSLTPDCFYVPAYAKAFRLFAEIWRATGTLDGHQVVSEATKRGLDVGQLIEAAARGAHAPAFERHIRVILEHDRSRRLQAALSEAERAAAAGIPAAEVETSLRAKLGAIAQPEGSDALAELHDDLQAAVNGERFAVPLPWPMLSRATRALQPGTVTDLCGSPGSTKSFAGTQAMAALQLGGYRTAVLELEDGRAYHLRRVLAQVSGCSRLTDDDWCRANPGSVAEAMAAHRDTMQKLESCIDVLPDGVSPTPDSLLAWVQRKADAGFRVLVVDPITLMIRGRASWEADEKFLFGAKRIVEKAGASLVLVTHPRRLPHGAKNAQLTMDDLAGGAAYARFSQTILYLRAHDPQSGEVKTALGTSRETWNRTFTIFKARNGPFGPGGRYACQFDPESLTLRELGRIVSEDKR
ncbi:MAG: hypothetical protein AMXMBFR7_26740 [Planctomycetota bacterium]